MSNTNGYVDQMVRLIQTASQAVTGGSFGGAGDGDDGGDGSRGGRIGGCGGGDQIPMLSSLSRRQKNTLFRAILRAGLGALWPPPSPQKSSGSNSKSSSRIGSWRSPVSCR
ncbi:hypothetical protein H0G86_002797 [Trichoderma simmonsii]|uniref:Uncharacterized protein n=1 Tax=Trichoderma simmonsii TaxID=1491479 RepID=A0A8G0PAG9_9HYPO|nr:hypothetical protein H0G86_002797 [Trichoderma simmonsii]